MFKLSKSAMCWAAKGGSGTSVIVACTALSLGRPVLIVDLAGDQSTILGVVETTGPGLLDWVVSDAPPARLAGLEIAVADGVSLLAGGTTESRLTALQRSTRWAQLARWLADDTRTVLIDAGTHPTLAPELIGLCEQRLLVTRPCYLALRAATTTPLRPTGVVVVREPGRALKSPDIVAALGVPVVAEVMLDPAIARAVDAGLLAGRIPKSLRRELRSTP